MFNQSAADKGFWNMETKEEVNPELYKKEFAILDGLYEWLSFDIYEDSLLCKANFYKTMAWYIETQKEESVNWEEKVQALLDTITSYDDEAERFKFMYYHFGALKLKWFREHDGWKSHANIVETALSNHHVIDRLYTRNEKGQIRGIFPGMVSPAIPQWFWIWVNDQDLMNRVIAYNRRSFAKAIRHGMNKSDKQNNENT